MIVASEIQSYTVLDAGAGMKLENWAGHILARPEPQAIWPKQHKELWQDASAWFERGSKGSGTWHFAKKVPKRWVLTFDELSFYVRPTDFKHTGLFPEQSSNWRLLKNSLVPGDQVLNLFAYTGGATLAAASAGASVTHVDAAKSIVGWAKENAALSGLTAAPIRYMVDDCLQFVLREQRRGKTYQAIVMDPPSFGRGSNGALWRIEDALFELVAECAKLLKTPKLFIINSYTAGFSSVVTKNLLQIHVQRTFGGHVQAEPLVLPIQSSDLYLPCGNTARWMP